MTEEKRFNGWDWTELAKVWGCYVEDDEEITLELTQQYIEKRITLFDNSPEAEEMKRIANDVREYLTALIENERIIPSEYKKVWETLLTLSDFTLLQMFCRLLPLAWA